MIVRTINSQIQLWMTNALICYGMNNTDLERKDRVKIYAGGTAALVKKGPKAARDLIYDMVEKRYVKSYAWPTRVKAK